MRTKLLGLTLVLMLPMLSCKKPWYGTEIDRHGRLVPPEDPPPVWNLPEVPTETIEPGSIGYGADVEGEEPQPAEPGEPVPPGPATSEAGPDGGMEVEEEEPGDDPNDTPPPVIFGEEIPGAVKDCRDPRVVYGGQADAPLRFPVGLRSRDPLHGDPKQTGPIDGAIGSGRLRIGNAFEFHADLVGAPQATSEQFAQMILLSIDKRTGRAGQIRLRNGNTFPTGVGFGGPAWDPEPSYSGNTATGVKLDASGTGTIYEGTNQRIHWIDAPQLYVRPNPASNSAIVMVLLLRSEVTDGAGVGKCLCLTGHTLIIDQATGNAMDARAARALLNRAAPAAGNAAPATIRRIVGQLKAAANDGGFQGQDNPEFRHLGCYVR